MLSDIKDLLKIPFKTLKVHTALSQCKTFQSSIQEQKQLLYYICSCTKVNLGNISYISL